MGKIDDEIMDIEALNTVYTPLSLIKDELNKRSENIELRNKIKVFFGENLLKIMMDEQRAVLSRSIMSPNAEMLYFFDVVKELGLSPLLLEYNCKFVSKNSEKYNLCNLPFVNFDSVKGDLSIVRRKVVDFNKNDGKTFSEINTLWGVNLVDFHHDMLRICNPSYNNCIYEFSNWFNKTRGLTEYYYLYYLSLFVCNGVLFDNYMLNDVEERKFFYANILPSFNRVKELFGFKPLICPLLPIKSEKSVLWMSYDSRLLKYLDDIIKK